MKTLVKSVLFLALVSICCQSCFKNPEAAYSYEPADNPESGEEITFINESFDAKDLYWDFGNDQSSEEEMPVTVYPLPGTYTVTLVAENLFHSDSISENILISPPTILEVSFYDYDGVPIQMARVKLFASYNDAINGKDLIRAANTNSYGTAMFRNVDAIQYYVTMVKYVNSSQNIEDFGSWSSGSYVGPLMQNVINSYYAWADFYPDN